MQLFAGAAAPNAAGDADIIKDGSIQTFARDVLDASMQVPVLVDFWAPWCGPCRALAPLIDRLAGEYAGQIKVGKLDIDQHTQTPSTLRISAIPTIILFHGGREVERWRGPDPRDDRKFKTALANLGVA